METLKLVNIAIKSGKKGNFFNLTFNDGRKGNYFGTEPDLLNWKDKDVDVELEKSGDYTNVKSIKLHGAVDPSVGATKQEPENLKVTCLRFALNHFKDKTPEETIQIAEVLRQYLTE